MPLSVTAPLSLTHLLRERLLGPAGAFEQKPTVLVEDVTP